MLAFHFAPPRDVADGVELGIVTPGGADAPARAVVRIVDERRSSDGIRRLVATPAPGGFALSEDDVIGLVYAEIERVLEVAFGDRWMAGFEQFSRLDARYLRRDRFADSLVPPFVLVGIANIAHLLRVRDARQVAATLRGLAAANHTLRNPGGEAVGLERLPWAECIELHRSLKSRRNE